VLVNLQKRYVVPGASLGAFVHNLRRRLRLGKKEFNICIVDDPAIRHLNLAYRGKDAATDVLSFPWDEPGGRPPRQSRTASGGARRMGITNFLGDVVISVDTARRNAAQEGHAARNEICWLILHGVLHLLGYDHEQDYGEMTRLEWELREALAVAGEKRKTETRKSKVESRKSKVENRRRRAGRGDERHRSKLKARGAGAIL
jgi:probable rRNA maturation factor